MQKANHIRVFTILFMVVLLFASILSNAFSPVTHSKKSQPLMFSKKAADSHSSTKLQLPNEEQEKEEENGSEEKSRHALIFICLINDITLPDLGTPNFSSIQTQRCNAVNTGTPLFLTHRSILI